MKILYHRGAMIERRFLDRFAPTAQLACAARRWAVLLVFPLLLSGCSRERQQDASADPASPAASAPVEGAEGTAESETAAADSAGLPAIEVGAEQLLAARLPIEATREGWVRLFDGHTFFGWEIASPANWQVQDEAITVDSGEVGLICTSIPWQDFELHLEVQADAQTNSGIFLRTPLDPQDPATDCYEINIAPSDNPFPSGSIVGRQRSSSDLQLQPQQWHRFEISLVGGELTVQVDGQTVAQYTDPQPLAAGRIGLQHNQGAVAFRDIRIRPVNLQPTITEDLSLWKQYPEMDGEFRIDESGGLRVTGGRGQLESLESYSDFALLAQCKTASEKLNSGIFFRCIPGETMNGYECQISNEMVDGNPLAPADTGTGGIFRRQDARIVAAEDGEWFTMLLVAHGPQVAAWVNGLQVTDWTDTRAADANPRRGLRLEPGTLMIQAHDPTTDLLFKRIDVVATTPGESSAAKR